MFRRDKKVGAIVRRLVARLRVELDRVPIRRRLLIVIGVCLVMVSICVRLLVVAMTGSSSSALHIDSIQKIRIADDSTERKYEEAKMYKRIEDSIKQKR